MNLVIAVLLAALGGFVLGCVVTFLVARNNPKQAQAAIDAANQIGKKL